MDFELVGPIGNIQTIVVGRTIRELAHYAGVMAEVVGEN
jgi:hypothetical protein